MEGRIVLVKLLCKDTANARIGVFSPCIAFRVAGSPGKTLNSFDSFTNSSLDEDDDAMDLSLHPFTRLLRRAFASSGTPSAHPCNPRAKSEQSQNSFLFFFSCLVRVDGNHNKRTFRHTHLYCFSPRSSSAGQSKGLDRSSMAFRKKRKDEFIAYWIENGIFFDFSSENEKLRVPIIVESRINFLREKMSAVFCFLLLLLGL